MNREQPVRLPGLFLAGPGCWHHPLTFLLVIAGLAGAVFSFLPPGNQGYQAVSATGSLVQDVVDPDQSELPSGPALAVRPARGLQDLIDQARPGATVEVPQGIWEGSLVISKKITLNASGQSILRWTKGSRPDTLEIRADGALVRGLVIEGSATDLKACNSGILVTGNQVGIEDCEIRRALFGILALQVKNLVIKDCRISGLEDLVTTKRGDGIRLDGVSGGRISACTIASVCDGIYFDHSDTVSALDNEVQDARYALHLMYSHKIQLANNVCTANTTGCMIMESREVEVRGGSMNRQDRLYGAGLRVRQSSQVSVTRVEIRANPTGICVEKVPDLSLEGNLIASNALGIQNLGGNGELVLKDNTLTGNLEQIGGVEAFDIRESSGSGKNFWDDYPGLDLDADGIGDGPYRPGRTFADLAGRLPAAAVFFGSPFQQVMSALSGQDSPQDPKPRTNP